MKTFDELAVEHGEDVDALMVEMQQQLQLYGGNLDLSDLVNTIHNRIDSVAKFIMSQVTTTEDLMTVMQEMDKFLSFDKVSQMYITLSKKMKNRSKLVVPK